MEKVKKTAAILKETLGLYVITGNIATYTQAMSYKKHGLDFARVGVGGGSVCITREVAGVGVPQLAAVLDTVASGLFIIADGGIKGSKDVAKAIAAGANLVMVGSLFAGTAEAPKIRDEKGNLIYRGQASASYMKDNKTKVNEFRAAEGVEVTIKEKGPVSEVLHELSGGLRSSMSYAGARTIKEFQEKAIFNYVSRAAHFEGTPHMIYRS
jgi:IMP dehydrogenase